MHQKQISDIQPGDTSTPLNVRVIRKWRPHSKNNEMCYLFVDIHGDAIEAIIDSNEENYFHNIITVHSCYTITKYLCIPSRTYMAVVPHTTSLKIGKRATFEELLHSDIPTYYFNFTSYNALKSHMNIHKLLTGTLQLESTSATTISINPPIPDINVFANKFKHLKTPTFHSQEKSVTIEELLKITIEERKHTQFTCLATITNIFNYRTWYYALCSECTKKVYPEEHNLVCEDHGTIIEPKYMYCVNAAVADETSSTNMVFFNEAMTSILNISCADMVIIHGHTDPKIIPTPLLSLRGIPMNLHITLKKDGTISVHKANQTIGNAKTSTSLEMDAPSTTMTLTKSKKQVQHQKGAFIQKPSKKKIKR
ncbi:hypothetical protein E3N88_27459 [Mikania micrantha]|uniref:Uncharacterized protein n=1 Tax=Mikania micrantha TaxID=192012 RepID=A0A5N6MWV1_9ASTR|nr:hypothetical protein E3N88_27459 [Mikania micrantha]